jgi:hypothetical protein
MTRKEMDELYRDCGRLEIEAKSDAESKGTSSQAIKDDFHFLLWLVDIVKCDISMVITPSSVL